MADMGRVYRHSPLILGQIKLQAGDVVGLMLQESVLAGLNAKQKFLIMDALQQSIDREAEALPEEERDDEC